MSIDRIKSQIASEDERLENARREVKSDLEDLERLSRSCQATGIYDSRVHQTALRLMEKDIEIRALEMALVRMKAAAGVTA